MSGTPTALGLGAPPVARPGLLRRMLRHRGAALGLLLLAVVAGVAIAAPYVYPRNPLRIVARPEIWPLLDARYPLGTDSLGRDVAAMLAHGARASLAIGLVASLTASLIGVTVGALAGFLGRWWDEVLMRLTELLQVVPGLVLVLSLVAVLGSSVETITLAVGIVAWPAIARLTRAEVLSLKERDFVTACRSLGLSGPRILLGEILPNALPPVIVLSSLAVASAILFESAVSFLGLGDPNVASWGRMIGEGRTLIRTAPYLCLIPGLAITATVLALNLVGDALNDALNPRLRDR